MRGKMLIRGRGDFIDWHEYDQQGHRSKLQAKGRAKEKRRQRRIELRRFLKELRDDL